MLKLNKLSPISLLKKYNCMKCHNLFTKDRIPSFYDISLKYKNNKNYKKTLIKKIKLGGKGVWGNEFMPKNIIKINYIKLILNWILKMKNI